ncbi:MAG: class I SAM-dependent methyltransferase [Anaerolineae bacterium]|jgi:SAM-dependent methyltransferase
MTVWHEQDEFWETMPMFGQERIEAAPQEVEQVISMLRIEPGARVLDMCCGIGRHSLEFARLGYAVTGVDRTAAYLQTARQAAAAEGLEVEWVLADAREFVRPEAFDHAINLYTSFGYFEEPAEDRLMAENIFRSLRAGGSLMMDLMGKERLARIFIPRSWEQLPDGSLFLQERTIKDDWTWIEVRWILIEDGQQQEFALGHRLYDGAGLRALLLDAGFEMVDLYGDMAGAPYDNEARRLVAVARKAEIAADR